MRRFLLVSGVALAIAGCGTPGTPATSPDVNQGVEALVYECEEHGGVKAYSDMAHNSHGTTDWTAICDDDTVIVVESG